MGYRVGGQCFATSEEASNYKMSMVAPTITADGSLKMPVYRNGNWYFGSQQVILTFPECDPVQPLKEGIEIGLIIASCFFVVFLVKSIKQLISKTQIQEVKD